MLTQSSFQGQSHGSLRFLLQINLYPNLWIRTMCVSWHGICAIQASAVCIFAPTPPHSRTKNKLDSNIFHSSCPKYREGRLHNHIIICKKSEEKISFKIKQKDSFCWLLSNQWLLREEQKSDKLRENIIIIKTNGNKRELRNPKCISLALKNSSMLTEHSFCCGKFCLISWIHTF